MESRFGKRRPYFETHFRLRLLILITPIQKIGSSMWACPIVGDCSWYRTRNAETRFES